MNKKLKIIGILAGLIALAGCSPQKDEKRVEEKPRTVKTATVQSRDLPIVVNAVGRLAANREVVLSAQVSGIVQQYSVDTGDIAETGDMVITIDPADYQLALNEARANLLSAKARHAAAQKSYARAKQLLPENVITPELYDKVEAEYKATRAVVSQAEAMVNISQRRFDKTVIAAPFDGYITKRLVEIGQNINIGDPVLAIADMQRMRVKIHVNEQDYVHLDKNDAVSVFVEAYPGKTFTGKVDRIGVKADPQTNTFEVEILVDNTEGSLKAGLTATVNITIDHIRNAVMIPQSCVLFRQNRKEIFVVEDGDRAAVREVKLGRVDGALVRILVGLLPGDQLVTTGSQYLKNGDSVTVDSTS